MTGKQLNALFEKHHEEYLKFDAIPPAERRHPRPDLCGLLYLHERFGGEGNVVRCAERNEVWFNWIANDLRGFTAEDAIYLLRCGIRWSHDVGSLSLLT